MILPLLHKVLLKQDELKELKEYEEKKASITTAIPGFEFAEADTKAELSRDQASVDYCTVVDIGPSAYKDYKVVCPIEIGDRVIIARYAGKVVKDGEEQLLIVNDEDILAKINKESSDG